jgi:hypothetical protein
MFQDNWKNMSSTMRQSMDNRDYLADVVRADEFDPKAFDEAVKRIRGVQDLISKKKTESTKDLLSAVAAGRPQKAGGPGCEFFRVERQAWRQSAA